MRLACKVAGAVLLLLTGFGCGTAAYWRRREAWQRLHTLTQLLWYLQSCLTYKPLPVKTLLGLAASYPQFAGLHLADCRSLAELPLPPGMNPALRGELQAELAALGTAPRQTVCTALKRLQGLCQKESGLAAARAEQALQLYPRLGACAGLLAAILFL